MTPESFKAKYKAFKDIEDSVVQNFIDSFDILFSSFRFGNKKEIAKEKYVAHELTINSFISESIASASASSGTIKSEKTPDFSIEYDTSTTNKTDTSDSYYSKTMYGLQLLEIIKLCSNTSFIVRR